MAVPLTLQLFDAFLGSQEGIHSVVLPDIFSSGGSQNVYIDKYARVGIIPGYAKQNAAAFTTDTGGSTAIIRGLIPYRKTAGGSVTRKLLFVLDDTVDEWEVHVSTDTGVTKSFLYDAGAASVGMIPDAAQLADTVYICNGVVQPRKYDGTTFSATGLTQSPTITATDSGNNGNLTGVYYYKMVSLVSGVRQNGSLISTQTQVVAKQMTLGWAQDANVAVTGYEIYRTTGTGNTFYYLTTIGARATTSYTDNITDTTLLEQRILEEHGDAPPIVYFCEPHKSRMWWLRTDANPTRGYWSDAGLPESVYAQNFLDFSDSMTVGDQITGGFGNYEGLFVVFTEKALWTVSGTGAIIGDITDWTKTHTNAATGCVSGRSAVRIPAGSKYTDQTGQHQTTSVNSIAYWTPLGDIRIFDGENDLIVSHPMRDTVRAFSYTNRRKIWAMVDSSNDQAIWCFPSSSVTECDTFVCWNFRFGVWYKWTAGHFGHGTEFEADTDAAILLVGENNILTGGFIYEWFKSGITSFDGAAIDARWMTKTLYGLNEQGQPAVVTTKRWRWMDLLFRSSSTTSAATTVSVSWLNGTAPDDGAPLGTVLITPSGSFILSADGSFLLSADGSFILTAASTVQGKAQLHTASNDYLHDTGMRLRVSTNDTTSSWFFEAMTIAYQLLPGQKRRFQ
jgi:hypothetical protein